MTPKTQAKAKELQKEEIISSISLEDWLDTLDRNLGDMVFDMGAENLLKISRVATVSRLPRPKARDKAVSGTQGLRPAAFAAVLIWLERLGFDTHPEGFYEPLLEGIKRAKYIDSEELTCLWHFKERKPTTPSANGSAKPKTLQSKSSSCWTASLRRRLPRLSLPMNSELRNSREVRSFWTRKRLKLCQRTGAWRKFSNFR